ncbi:hypothetical protein Tco_0560280, partial [Tanacetum coccineum]
DASKQGMKTGDEVVAEQGVPDNKKDDAA